MRISSAVIQEGNNFLIGKRAADKKFAPGQWEFISGFVDEGEDPEDTIKREIKEELGCGVKSIKPLADYTSSDEEGVWEVSPFLVVLDGKPRLGSDHSELNFLSWSELAAIPELADDIKAIGELK